MSIRRSLPLLALAAALAGCASVKMPEPSASAGVVQAVRAANAGPAKVGAFTVAPGKDPAMDKSLSGLRGSSVEPYGGAFSQQLRGELVAALKAAGLLDEGAPVAITGQLTDSFVDAAISTGKARLAARFTVERAGRKVFDKELAVASEWESSFIGAIAIPAAIDNYNAQYKALIGKLFADAEFRAAIAR